MNVIDLGRIAYEPCRDYQRAVLDEVAAGTKPSTLILCEHDPVITLGANFHAENLLLTRSQYHERGIQVIESERGGDVTYHGPGQLVVYPIFDLCPVGKDLHAWLRDLEEAIIQAIATYGLSGERLSVNTGVWVNSKKIAAIGIKVRRWVSMHGIALNCDLDLEPFKTVVPCGVVGYGVTSVSKELGRQVTVPQVKPAVIDAFHVVFKGRA